jgi:GDP-4-dehydro-6-deoxy-D-mannose reductase
LKKTSTSFAWRIGLKLLRENNVNSPGRSSSSPTEKTRWLVLGVAGFIGRAMLAELKKQGRNVTGADRVSGGFIQPVDVFDAPSLRMLLREWQPSILLNAIGHDPTADLDLTDFYFRSSALLLEAVQAEAPSCRVLLLGSAAEYGNSGAANGSREIDPQNPLSDYGRAKCEQFTVASRFAASGLAVTTARLFNPIGSGQGRHQFVGALLERIRNGQKSLSVRHGNCVRDWIDVRDVARALVILGESSTLFPAVNICSGKGHTVEFIARIVAQLMKVEVECESETSTPDLLWRSVGDPERIFGLGWRPEHSLAETLADQCRFAL